MSDGRVLTGMDLDKSNELWIICPNCKAETLHTVLSSAKVSGSYDSLVHFCDILQIVECNGCKYSSFRKVHTDSQQYGFDPETGEKWPYEVVELFPTRLEGRGIIRHMNLLPNNIQRIYRETIKALCNETRILTGIGIRILIEAVCKEKEAKGYKLQNRIDSLVEMGVLTKERANILHSLRIMGNEAAHEIKPHSERQLFLAMDVVEHLLNGVYILPNLVRKHLPEKK